MKGFVTPSIRSTRSRKSILTDKGVKYSSDQETVKEFEECFPQICVKYGLMQPVRVKKEYISDQKQVSSTKKMQKEAVSHPNSASSKVTIPAATDDKDTLTTPTTDYDDDTITLIAFYDYSERFVQLLLYKLKETPPELIKLFGYLARYYSHLKRIKIQFCIINTSVIYELVKVICLSSLNEVDLDGSVIPTGNYELLFDNARLSNISLSKCCITDAVCEIISSKLCFRGPAESSLFTLNLSSNRIMDAGAKHLSTALRSNRTLRYLNLSDNRITDTGASYILSSLKEFPLTREENLAKSQRYMIYEKQRLAIYFKYLTEYSTKGSDDGKKTNEKKKPLSARKTGKPNGKESKQNAKSFTFEDYKNRAEVLAGEIMGPFRDPFQVSNVSIRDGKCYSMGNMTLCHLNLAYNNLAYPSVVKLLDVLQYQRDAKRVGQTGLMRVVITGNNMPDSCMEYAAIDELLNKCMMTYGGRAFTDLARRKSRLSRASVMPEKMLLMPR